MVSIRHQILMVLVLVLFGAVGGYLLLAIDLFSKDRLAYTYDLVTSASESKAEETRAVLQSRMSKLLVLGALTQATEPELRSRVLASDSTDLWVEIHDLDDEGHWQRGQRIVQAEALAPLGLSSEDLVEIADASELPIAAAYEEGMMLFNLSRPPDAPILAMAVRDPTAPRVVVGYFYPDQLLRLISASKLYEVYVVDPAGRVVVHADRTLMVRRTELADQRIVKAALETEGAVSGAREFEAEGGTVLGSFTQVSFGGLTAVATIPKSQALAAVARINEKTALFAIGIVCLGLIVSIFFSRRLAGPLAELENATQRIARGEFSTQLAIQSPREIGQLAGAINRMSSDLAERDRNLSEAYATLHHQDRLATIGTLAAGVAHEINSPLTFILTSHSFLEDAMATLEEAPGLQGNDAVDEAREALADMTSGLERVRDIARSMTRFARVDGEQDDAVDLNEAVQAAVRMAGHELKFVSRVDVELSDVPPVRGNDGRLSQVFLNLLVNAAHALREAGSEDGQIRVVTRSETSGEVVAELTDTGPGIAPADQARVFDAFFTTKPAGVGTGLGLAICRRIIEGHDGRIELDSRPGRTCFRMVLPAFAPTEDHSAPDASGATAPESETIPAPQPSVAAMPSPLPPQGA